VACFWDLGVIPVNCGERAREAQRFLMVNGKEAKKQKGMEVNEGGHMFLQERMVEDGV
jgi:hypothetical protein